MQTFLCIDIRSDDLSAPVNGSITTCSSGTEGVCYVILATDQLTTMLISNCVLIRTHTHAHFISTVNINNKSS